MKLRQTSPCKECKKRVVGCHANCEAYKTFKQAVEQERQQIQQNKSYVIPKGSWTGDEGLLRRRR